MKFENLKFNNTSIVKSLHELNITNLTDIQEKTIPIALSGKSIIGQARTGSGKTYSFAIPIVERLKYGNRAEAVILVPTRELCKQVAKVIEYLGKYNENGRRLRIVQVYGGVSIQNQIKKIKNGINIIVATPGRLIDLFKREIITFKNIRFVVLDEADRMMDMGFLPDIEYILNNITSAINHKPQFFLFSATILEEIKKISSKFTGGDVVDIDVSHDDLTVGNTQQFYYLIPQFRDKYYHFVRILRKEKPKHALVFINTKRTADWLEDRLKRESGLNFRIDKLSGSMSQTKREKVTEKFKKRQINFLIATDVAARGLDLPDVSHVFNYDIPQYEENYVHRIGRTSRMKKSGVEQKMGIAITLCLQDEYIYLCRIEDFINKSIKKRDLPPRSSNNRRSSNGYRQKSGRSNNKRYRTEKKYPNEKRSSPRKRLPFF
ncbi:MAG: DEAD/DEAH box helicase [Promethearchaeota archaeon]